ncbi:MAG: hypothetical protein WAN65_28140 [Candidatus Sulfotelmatobacter sp.]
MSEYSYMELSAVTKVYGHGGHLVIGDFDFLDDFTGDRAIGTPATNWFASFHYAPPSATVYTR